MDELINKMSDVQARLEETKMICIAEIQQECFAESVNHQPDWNGKPEVWVPKVRADLQWKAGLKIPPTTNFGCQ